MLREPRTLSFIMCVIGICVPLGLYSVAQEFVAVHTYSGESLIQFPMFVIALNRTGACIFAVLVLKSQNLPVFSQKLGYSILPAISNGRLHLCRAGSKVSEPPSVQSEA